MGISDADWKDPDLDSMKMENSVFILAPIFCIAAVHSRPVHISKELHEPGVIVILATVHDPMKKHN